MWPDALADATAALGAVERVAAIGLLLASAELLARPRTMAADGLLSWNVSRLRSPHLVNGRRSIVLDALLVPPGVHGLVAARAAAAIVVLLAPTGSSGSVLGLVACAGTSLLLMVRTSYGNDGADQMLLLVIVASALAQLEGSPTSARFALWFVALQCVLSYATSGVGKLAGRPWRDGTGLTGVLTTATYGSRRLAELLHRHPRLAVAVSWSIIATETTFVAVLFVPDRWVAVMLVGGMTFHVATAVVMGLNAFVLAFGAAYPAIAYVAL